MNIEIANRLVNLRKNNNLSQEALAEKLGISRQAVSKWERAEASPDTDNLILLARLYGVSLDELLQTDDEIPVPEEINENSNVSNYTYETKEFEQTREPIQKQEDNPATHLMNLIVILGIVITYIMISFFWNAWHPGWLLFLLIPIWHSTVEAISKKNLNLFAYPVVAALIYLCMGFFCGMWHPGWVIFITIPLYYALVNYVSAVNKDQEAKKKEEFGDEK